MYVAVEALFFFAYYQQDLGVGLQAQHAVDDVHSRCLQLLGPLDVVVFIEAGFQFNKGHHLLAVFGGPDQCCHHR